MGLHYHDASISKFAQEIGANAVGLLNIAERLSVQRHILKRYLEELHKAPRPAITDRTPLDMIAYMLGEVTMHNTTPEDGAQIHEYVQKCLIETGRHFDSVIVVRPLPFYENDPSKPPANVAYQWQTQFIIEGASEKVGDVVSKASLLTNDLEERIGYSIAFITSRLNALRQEAAVMKIC
jgi:hypothetical protein